MKLQRHTNLLLALAAALLLLVAGCGGTAGSGQEVPTEPAPTVDTPVPSGATLIINSPIADGLYSQAGPVLSYTATDSDGQTIPVDRMQAQVHDVVDSEFTLTRPVTDLEDGTNLPDSPDGLHSLEFTVTHEDGSVLVTVFVPFRTDTAAPEIEITGPSSEFVVTDPTPLLQYIIHEPCFDEDTGVSECGETVLLDGDEIPTRNGEPLPALSDGVHELEILLADEAGNVTSATHSFTVDATPPSVTLPPPPPPPEEPPPPEDPPPNDPIQDNGTVSTEDGDLTVTSNEEAEAVVYLDPSSECLEVVALGDPDGLCSGYRIDEDPITILEDETVTITIEDLGALELGEHTLVIVAEDAVGNVSIKEVKFVVTDPEAPQIVVTSADGLLPAETVAVDGPAGTKTFPLVFEVTDDHAESGALTVTVDVELWDAAMGPEGDWTKAANYTFDQSAGTLTVTGDGDSDDSDGQSETGDGTYRVTISAIDGAPHTTTVAVVVTVDTTAPDVEITSPPAGDVTPTGKPQLEVASSEEAAFDVQIFMDGNPLPIPIDGKLQQPGGADLAEGEHTVVVEITDAAGNTGSGSSTFTVDAAGPQVTISAPADGQTISGDTVTLRFEAVEADTIEALLTSAAYPDSPVLVPLQTIDPVQHTAQTYEKEFSLLVQGQVVVPDGDYTIQLIASDSNSVHAPAESEPVTVHVDGGVPTVTIASPSGEGVFFNPGDPIPVEFTATNAVSMFVKLDGETVQAYSGPGIGSVTHALELTAPENTGGHDIEIVAYDGNDQPNAQPAIVTIYVNGTAPVVTIHSPKDGKTYHGNSVTLHYTIETENEIASETVLLNGEELDLESLNHHHHHLWWWWNHRHHGDHDHDDHHGHEHHNGHHFHLQGLDDGDYTIEVQAKDEAGNVSETASVSFSIQTHHHDRNKKTSCFFKDQHSWKKVVKCLSKKAWDEDD